MKGGVIVSNVFISLKESNFEIEISDVSKLVIDGQTTITNFELFVVEANRSYAFVGKNQIFVANGCEIKFVLFKLFKEN